MILTQTTALFVDAYRELNARKLFWITMALNILAVALFALPESQAWMADMVAQTRAAQAGLRPRSKKEA